MYSNIQLQPPCGLREFDRVTLVKGTIHPHWDERDEKSNVTKHVTEWEHPSFPITEREYINKKNGKTWEEMLGHDVAQTFLLVSPYYHDYVVSFAALEPEFTFETINDFGRNAKPDYGSGWNEDDRYIHTSTVWWTGVPDEVGMINPYQGGQFMDIFRIYKDTLGRLGLIEVCSDLFWLYQEGVPEYLSGGWAL